MWRRLKPAIFIPIAASRGGATFHFFSNDATNRGRTYVVHAF